jgi:glycerol-3-phosphate dehydrogenase
LEAGNSGIIHGGFDPIPGTLSAKLNRQGRYIYEELFCFSGNDLFELTG